MSQENVEAWRVPIEHARTATTEADLDATLGMLETNWDPDIEHDASEAEVLDLKGVYRGKEAVRRWWRDWFAAWEVLEFEYELRDAGDRVVFLIDVMRLRGRHSGVEVPFGKHAWVSTFRNGLMVHSRLYMNQSQALEAAGLSE